MRPYKMPEKSTIKHAGCFENKPVERRPEVLKLVQFKFDKSYREIGFIVDEKNVARYVSINSLLSCVLVTDTIMMGVIKTLFSGDTIEKCSEQVVPFDKLHDICDAIVSRKVETRAKNRAKELNSLTELFYQQHVSKFPVDKIKASITNTSLAIQDATIQNEQEVRALVRNLIRDLNSLIGD